MNFLLPGMNILPMHCSANMDPITGATAIFFGLSGTGKTTLSTDPNRLLIGDDEHGWSDHGVFNFEGGCYAKCINLKEKNEPEIYHAIKFGSLVENVVMDPVTRKLDFNDKTLTENTRVGYPINFISNARIPGIGRIPNVIIFLTADAFGVLPPISRLTQEGAMYHFITGFTSKLAGTERGITEPQPSFSPAFGEAFLTLHPTMYSKTLIGKMKEHGAKAYLVNTGWNGTGKRISLKDTRAIIDAIIDGSIEKAEKTIVPIMNLEIPTALPNVSEGILDPRATYADASEWEVKAKDLAGRYIKNFEQYCDNEDAKALIPSGPQL